MSKFDLAVVGGWVVGGTQVKNHTTLFVVSVELYILCNVFPAEEGAIPGQILVRKKTQAGSPISFVLSSKIVEGNMQDIRKDFTVKYPLLCLSHYCQAQPQLQLSWAELALISAKTLTTHQPTNPPVHPGK